MASSMYFQGARIAVQVVKDHGLDVAINAARALQQLPADIGSEDLREWVRGMADTLTLATEAN